VPLHTLVAVVVVAVAAAVLLAALAAQAVGVLVQAQVLQPLAVQ
jgi:hypothetical protein